MSSGVLAYDFNNDLAICFSLAGIEFLADLYCGACLDVFVGGQWLATRIERNISTNTWYLAGFSKDMKPTGLLARI